MMKNLTTLAATLLAGAAAFAAPADGAWYYRPYEYEAWMLQRMCGEVRRGLTNVSYPGKFLTLAEEPAAVWSETPRPGMEPIPGGPGTPPHRAERPETPRPLTFADGLYDVGGEDIGYVRVASANPPPRLFVGESRAEALNSDTNAFEQVTDMVVDGPGRWRSAVPLALRYFRFAAPVAGEVTFHSQVDRRAPAGGFTCDDPRLVETWRTGVETLRLCTRTFLVDGIKRDRLPWAGDLAVEILAQAYAFGDPEPVKRTLAAIGSGDPRTTGNVNGIAAFSMWWIVGHDLLQRYFDAADYLKLHYPRIRERMEELFTHEDGRGFFARNLGWNFMDWTGRDGGQLRSEVSLQVIYFAALEAGARLADRVGDAASSAAWRARAAKLKAAILAVGMDGTRHSRILAIALGLVDGETARRYAREIAAGDLPPTMTPYMSTFEVIALVKGGETEAALAKYEAVWGAMTDFGVDAYWEGWDAADGNAERYVFYGRPFGKSLCHAWGSSPAFLIPGVFFGVRPTADAWRSHEVRPAVPGFARNAVVTVPTPAGVLRVPFPADAPAALFAFKPGEVAVGGEIGRRLDVSMEKILRHTDIEGAFAKHFKVRKEKPDEPGGFAGYGMLLDALVKGAAHGIGGDEAVALKTRLLKELAAAQSPDGQITMFLGKPGFWDSHENAYMIQSFVRDWLWFGEANSLETAKRLADSLIARKAPVTLGTETAFNLLYGVTREPRHLAYLKDVCFLEKPFDFYDANLQVNGVQHVYTWLARAIGQVEYADLLGLAAPADRARFGEPAFEALRRAQGPHLSVSGSITGTPRWGELWDPSQVGLGKWGETCASAYLMRLCARMSEWEGRSVLFDLYERVMHNAFFSAQSADGLKYRYFTPFDDRAAWWPRETYCCPNNFRRMVFEIPDAVFRRSSDGLAVCLYAPAELKAPGVTAKMETAYPEDGKVTLSVTMAPGVKTLRLRIPKWCEGARVTVGDVMAPAAPGWLEVRRDFSAGVTVALDLPMPVRLVRGVRAQEGRVAVMRGPCVYALEPALNGLKEHGVDVWDLDPTKPLVWKPAAHAVEVTLRQRHLKRTERRVLLTRYLKEERLRTFFGLAAPGESVADELTATSGSGE